MLATLLGLAQPYFLKILIDDAFVAGSLETLIWVAVGLFAVTVASLGLNALSTYRYVQVAAVALFDMRLALFRHLQSLSPRFFAARSTGDILSRLNSDVSEIQRVASDTLLALLTNAVFLLGSVVLLVHLEPLLFLVSLAVLPPALWALRRSRPRIQEQNRRVREGSAAIGSFLVESLLGMRQTVSLQQEERSAATFRERNDTFVRRLLDLQITNFVASGVPGTLVALSTLAVFLVGGWFVLQERMTMGAFVAFSAYQARLLSPLQNLMGLYLNVQAARASLERVFSLFDEMPEVVEAAAPIRLDAVRGEIELRDVGLSFGRGAPVLDGVSFRLAAGSSCALVGPSGVGKSTVADLLLRRLDPDRGEVRLDGHDLRSLALVDLRRQVAVVEQETFLWNGSIEENLRYGCPGATREELEGAVRAAALGDFVAGLPDGLATAVGERGLQLSAGQRQRLAVARVLLRRPRVLVLDEATSALDGESERSLVASLSELMRDATTLILSHRLPLVRYAERVLVLEGGRIVESGTVEELLERDGSFRRLFGGEAVERAPA